MVGTAMVITGRGVLPAGAEHRNEQRRGVGSAGTLLSHDGRPAEGLHGLPAGALPPAQPQGDFSLTTHPHQRDHHHHRRRYEVGPSG